MANTPFELLHPPSLAGLDNPQYLTAIKFFRDAISEGMKQAEATWPPRIDAQRGYDVDLGFDYTLFGPHVFQEPTDGLRESWEEWLVQQCTRAGLELVAAGVPFDSYLIDQRMRSRGRHPDGSLPGPDVLARAKEGILALTSSPPGTFKPRVTVIPSWAVAACSISAVQTLLSPLSWMGWILLIGVAVTTLKSARQEVSPVHAQILTELFISTNGARERGIEAEYLRRNLRNTLERVRDRAVADSDFDEALRELDSKGLVRCETDGLVCWGVLTIGIDAD